MIKNTNITGITSLMQGVGRLPDGRAVFIDGALPDENVDIEIAKDEARYALGRLVSVNSASSARVDSDCPYYERCGGCRLRHAGYGYGLELKKRHVIETLERIGGLESFPVDIVPSPVTRRYRNKAEYPIIDGRIGVFDTTGRNIVEIDDCLLQKDASVTAMRVVRGRLSVENGYLVTRVNSKGELMLILATRTVSPGFLKEIKIPGLVSVWHCHLKNRPTHALDGRFTKISGSDTLNERLCSLDFELSPQSFFQVNTSVAERLYDIAVGFADAGGKNVLDAYCGIGTISLCAAKEAKHVLGVEIIPQAIANAERSASANGLGDTTEFVCADAAQEISARIARGERYDCAIVDPPRKGCDKTLLDSFIDSEIERIIYVSCESSTLARDIRHMTANGYHVDNIKCVDMFPYTHHVETVVLLSRQ